MELKKVKDTPVKKTRKTGNAIQMYIDWLFEFYEFRINEITEREEFRKIGTKKWLPMKDRVLNTIKLQAGKNGFSDNISNKTRMIIRSEETPLVNEINDYFKNLKPKTKATIDKNGNITAPTIRQYFEMLQLQDQASKDTEMYFNLFTRFMIASVNSVLKIKHNDVMLMLSGPQGTYKTSYLNYLMPKTLGKEKYLLTGHITPDLTKQQTADAICEKFIINIDDQMEVIFGQAYNSMKAIISTDQVTNRRAYGIYSETRTRIANFVGTVNGAEFLTDSTNRRYFVIDIENISKAYNKVDMDKFWSEAQQLSQQINPYNVFDKSSYQQIIEIANNFVEESLEMILINEHFKAKPSDSYDVSVFMTTGEILRELQRNQPRTILMYKLSNELKRAKFTYKSMRLSRFSYPKKGYVLYIKNTDLDIFRKYVI